MAPSCKFSLVVVVLPLLFALTQAATFYVVNNCPYTVWAAATPGGGSQLNPGQTWPLNVNPGTSGGRVWGRTGCSFDGSGRGSCQTGDCGGVLRCTLSGRPPTTLAEYTLNGGNNRDYYDISIIDGFNVPMDFSPTSGGCRGIRCYDNTVARCPDAYRQPNDVKTFSCPSGTNYRVVFCP